MKTLSAKVPPDVKEEIEDYADERGLSRSQAIRRLIMDGLEANAPGENLSVRVYAAWIGSLLAAAMLTTPASTAAYALGYMGAAVFVVAITYPILRPKLPQMTTDESTG